MEKTERIELHCHSKSGGNATMYAGELIRYASMMNMPAIAITDRSNIFAFPEMQSVCETGQYSARPLYGMEMLVRDNDGVIYTVSILVGNETGKENLYRMISETDGTTPYPIFEYDLLMKYREGLLIGSGAENGKLRLKALSGSSDEVIKSIVRELDYVELLPYECDREINERLIDIAESEGALPVAVSDAHFLDTKDRMAWQILNHSLEKPNNSHGVHLLSTDEMLEAFSYLPDKKAEEIVIENTHRLASMCEDIHVYDKKINYPIVDDADERLRRICMESLESKYGKEKYKPATEMLEKELSILSKQEMSFYPLMIRDLLGKAGLRACDISLRGTSAGSIVLYLLGVSEVDPVAFKLFPEQIYGKDSKRSLDADLNVPKTMISEIRRVAEVIDGVGAAIAIGDFRTVSVTYARKLIEDYEIKEQCYFKEEEKETLCGKMVGNYVERIRHSSGIYVFPKDFDYGGYMPVQTLPDDVKATYFNHFYFDGSLLKLDIIPQRTLDTLRKLSSQTGVDLSDVLVDDEEVVKLIDKDAKGILKSIIDSAEIRHEKEIEKVKKMELRDFDDFVKAFGIVHGTCIRPGMGGVLANSHGYEIKDLIVYREDLFEYLVSKGLERTKAFEIAEYVRKGKAKWKRREWSDYRKEMHRARVSESFIGACESVGYLFPRAHGVSYMYMLLRLEWFRINYPEDYRIVMDGVYA